MRKRRSVALLGAAFALLVAAWVFSTPPFGGPDEPAHYLRALSLANGRLLGPRVGYIAPDAEQTAWVQHDVRGVFVLPRLAPPGSDCLDGRPDVGNRGCLEPTYTGDYQPLPYLLPALAVSAAGHTGRALWLGRVASAVPCLAFILLAFALLWSGTAISVLGLLAAITPTTLFVSSLINPNGLEIAASLAFVAGLLRLSRAPTSTPRWVWVSLASSGAAAVLAWQLGWFFVAAQAAALAALLGRQRLQMVAVTHRRELGITLAVLFGACVVYLVYGLSAGLLHGAFGVTPVGPSLRQGIDQLHATLYGAVGVFGALVIALPSHAYWVWWLLVVALLVGGLVLGSRRDRVVLSLVTLLALAFPVLFYAWIFRHSGFGLQARYVMPLLALIPLLAGELIFRSQKRLPRSATRLLLSSGVALVAVFQLFAWWIDARDWAGEPNAVWFLGHPRWSPPLGWWPWTLMAILGTGLLLSLATAELRSRRPTDSRDGPLAAVADMAVARRG